MEQNVANQSLKRLGRNLTTIKVLKLFHATFNDTGFKYISSLESILHASLHELFLGKVQDRGPMSYLNFKMLQKWCFRVVGIYQREMGRFKANGRVGICIDGLLSQLSY